MSAVFPGFKVVRYGPNTYFLGGELDMAVADALTQAIAPSVASGGSILLDFGNVTFIDSTGMNVIFGAAQTLGSRGCVFVHAPQRNVKRALDIVGMNDLPNVHVDIGRAHV